MAIYSKEERQKLLDKICSYIAEGGYLMDVCKKKDMPSRAMLYNWLKKDLEAMEAFRLAQQFRATVAIDAVQKLADDKEHDYIEVEFYDGNGEKHIEKQWSPVRLNQRRFQVDTMKWEAGKLCKIYGDKLTNEIVTPEGVEVKITIDD